MAIMTILTDTGRHAAIHVDAAAHVIEITDGDYPVPGEGPHAGNLRERRNSTRDEDELPSLFAGKLC